MGLALVILSWIFFFGWGSFALLASVLGSALLARRSWKAAVLGLACSPVVVIPAIFFLWGIGTYFAGSAVIWSTGHPRGEFWNLDHDLRCFRRTSGCVINGSEPLWQGPNNAGIRLIARFFGAVPGTYHGHYPSREEVQRRLEGVRGVLSWDGFLHEVETRRLKIRREEWKPGENPKLDLTGYNLFEVGDDTIAAARESRVSLFDSTTGLWYATYYLE